MDLNYLFASGFDGILHNIITEGVVKTGLVMSGILAGLGLLVAFVRSGFMIDMGWKHLQICADAQRGVSRKDLERIIEEKVSHAIETHMAAVESYKDQSRHCDDTIKSLIAHKLSDITIPEAEDGEFDKSELIALSIKLEMLLMNVENHYANAAESLEQIANYVESKYSRFCRILTRYSDKEMYIRRTAFLILTNWWGIVKPLLQNMAKQKIDFATSAQTVFSDAKWRKRMGEVIKKQTEIRENLEKTKDLKPIISDYLSRTSSKYDINDFD